MRFHIGPYTYRVRITEEPITDDATGGELLGKAVLHGREILIWTGVGPDQRLEVLLHELKHCWLFHFPRPQNEEEAASFFAAVTQQAMSDLDEQGGVPALIRLRPAEPMPSRASVTPMAETPASAVEPAPSTRTAPRSYQHQVETVARPHGGRAQCGVCEMILADGAIVSTPAKWDRQARGMTIDRSLYCPHCDHVQSWVEGADLYGRPNGDVVSGPTYKRGAEAEAFLREHPETTGMIVV